MNRNALLIASAVFSLTCACRSSGPIRETTDADGEVVRTEAAEEAQPAVDATAATARMTAYRGRKDAAERSEATRPVESNVAPETDEVENESGPADADDANEQLVAATVVANRMVAYRKLKLAVVRVAFHESPAESVSNPLAAGYDPFVERDCPPEGNAASAKNQKQNKLKNRIAAPQPSDVDEAVTVAALRAPGDDHDRWSTALAATIEGYCRSAKGSGGETCNCGKTLKSLTDTHFEIVSGPNDQGQPVIAEVTPVWRLIHQHFNLENWSSTKLHQKYEGHRVRITGWLFFDSIHASQANNTDPQDPQHDNWRATCGEIHQITSIEVLP